MEDKVQMKFLFVNCEVYLSLLILISKYLLMRLMEDGSKRTTMTKLN